MHEIHANTYKKIPIQTNTFQYIQYIPCIHTYISIHINADHYIQYISVQTNENEYNT